LPSAPPDEADKKSALRPGVLVTRPAAELAATGERLAALGYTPIQAPMLDIVTYRKTLPVDVQALLLTSANALPGLAHWPRPDIQVLAVGDVTAAKARAQGFTHVLSAGRDAEALAKLALQMCHPAGPPLLLPCGSGQGLTLATKLRGLDFRVTRRTVYKAVPARAFPAAAAQALAKQSVHAALFLSSETAAVFVRLLPAVLHPSLSQVHALAIGAPAADVLSSLPWREVRLAAAPTLDDVLALL
jgi:uroporphyrinogen-III synthase